MASSESIGLIKKKGYQALLKDKLELEDENINVKAENELLKMKVDHLLNKDKENNLQKIIIEKQRVNEANNNEPIKVDGKRRKKYKIKDIDKMNVTQEYIKYMKTKVINYLKYDQEHKPTKK